MLRRKQNPLRSAARLRTIVSVLAKHGFRNLAEDAKLGRFVLERFTSADLTEDYSTAQRLRMAFEQLGPTFVKLGQLLATRPDLVPQEWSEEFKRLHDQVTSVPFDEIEDVLNSHFGKEYNRVFKSFDTEPIAAASIAQVYKAELHDGTRVVVKVQRPHIEEITEEDLKILYTLAELLEKYVPETKVYNPIAIVDEFSRNMALETNFIVESNNVNRFAKNFIDEPQIKIPRVYGDYTGRRVLVMEELQGIPLSHKDALNQEGIDPEEVLRTGLRCYLKMVFTDGLFHGDLHAGNMFVMPNNQVGLIDFGIVGRLNHRAQSAIANMFIALAAEDYVRLAYEYVDISPYSESVDVDRFARELRDIISPYYGLTMKDADIGKMLMDSTGVAARQGLVLPSELVMFFKSIVTIEGMGRIVASDFDFLAHSLDFAQELVLTRLEPQRLIREFANVARDISSLAQTTPRQLKQLLRRMNSPDFSIRMDVPRLDDVKRAVDIAGDKAFSGFVAASLIGSATAILITETGPTVFGVPALSLISYAVASFIFLVVAARKA